MNNILTDNEFIEKENFDLKSQISEVMQQNQFL